jgi:dTDP-4-dehydrorhamnose reductase
VSILLIGSTGMLGSALRRARPAGQEWHCETHATLELTDASAVERALDAKRPVIVINTAAVLGVNPCARDPHRAFAVNALGPWHLARACARRGIGLVHFSTDAVFDGAKGSPYVEDDPPSPLNLYGMTKHLGDLAVRANCPRHWILRVPMLFGTRENRSAVFVERMLALAREGRRELRVAEDVVSSPSFSDDIAAATLWLLADGAPAGLYHLRNAGEASLYDLTAALFGRLGLDARVERARASEFSAGDLDVKPLCTPLGSTRIAPLRPWREALDEYAAQVRARREAGEP